MSEMVGRVAKAIWDACALQEPDIARVFPYGELVTGKEILDGGYDLEVVARAVIAAMREPTEEQYEVLSATDLMWRELNSKLVWQTYIDAALA